MQNLVDFFKDVLTCCSVMHGDKFKHFLINIKFTVTHPDEDYKLCYSSDVNSIIDSNRKMFKS